MKYLNYSTEDFLKDEYFIQWVKSPDYETDLFWKSWIQNHPEKVAVIRRAKEIIENINFNDMSAYEPTASEIDEVFSNILKKESSIYAGRTSQHQTTFLNLFTIRKVAAVFILVVLGSALYFYLPKIDENIEKQIASQVTKQNPKGQRSIITLTDGTVVHLNANSKLIVQEGFSKSNRRVTLEGEAFFNVVKDPHNPFSITTGDIITTVLGTSFNIHAYPNKADYQVALVTGKLVVGRREPNSDQVELKPNELINYNINTGTIVKESFTNHDFMAWKDGVLQFNEAGIAEIVERLELWYGVDISLEGEVGISRRFTGKFESKSLEYVLEGISYTSAFDFEIRENEIIIKNLK